MIGKSLKERNELGPLPEAKAVAALKEMLASHARLIVDVRAKDPRMVACLVVRADKLALRLCREIGFEVKPGGTAVFGLLGDDAARLFAQLTEGQRQCLASPCGARETRILLVADGIALLSLEAEDGRVAVRAIP
jgi:hypothetical protein